MKRLISILAALALLALLGYFLYSLNSKSKYNGTTEGISAVPENAAFIIRIKDGREKWSNFKKTTYGERLLSISETKSFSANLDSILKVVEQEATLSWMNSSPLLISGHMTGVNSHAYLLSTKVSGVDGINLESLCAKHFPSAKVNKRNYEQVEVYDIRFSESKNRFSVSAFKNLLLISSSPILLEEAILQAEHRTPLSEKKDFKKLYQTADLNLDANLFVNFSELGNLLQTSLSAKEMPLNKLGGWMEMDLKISDDGLAFNGFSSVNDSSKSFLSNFDQLSPQKPKVISVLPDNVAFMSYVGFGSFNEYLENYKELLQQKQKLYQFNKNIEKLDKNDEINAKEDIYSWIGEEFAFFITQGDIENPLQNACVAIGVKNMELAISKLNEIAEKTGGKADSSTFKNFQIEQLGASNILSLTLGEYFQQNKSTFYVKIEDYIIFGNSESNLKNVINSYLMGRTLVKSRSFSKFMSHFNNKSSYFAYLSPKRAKNFWSYFLKKDFAKVMDDNQSLISEYESVGFQTVSNKKLHFTNLYSNYNPVVEKESVSLVEAVLDTSFSTKPWTVENHYTKEKELLIQDDNNVLYLVNNVGIVLWSKKLDGPIIGDVSSIDKYRNKKWQFLMASEKKIYLLDRNGNSVEGFPIELKSSVTAGPAVIDYDGDKRYRILVPQGKYLSNFNKDGKKVKGWEFKGASASISQTPKWINIKNKDYVVFSDQNGKLYALNRKGETRINYSSTLPKGNATHSIVVGKSKSNSGILTTDTNGTVHMVNMNDELDVITTRGFTVGHSCELSFYSSLLVPDLIYREGEDLYIYKMNKELALKMSLPSDKGTAQAHRLRNGTKLISFTDKDLNNIYLYDEEGELLDNFPMQGCSEVKIEDITGDGNEEMIISTPNGNSYFYSIF